MKAKISGRAGSETEFGSKWPKAVGGAPFKGNGRPVERRRPAGAEFSTRTLAEWDKKKRATHTFGNLRGAGRPCRPDGNAIPPAPKWRVHVVSSRVKRPRRWRAEAGQQPMQRLSLALAHFERSRLVLVPQSLSPPSASLRCAAVRVCRRQWSSCVTLTGRCVAASLGEMSSSCSGGSASSSGGRQLGARPKIGRLPFEQQQTSLAASNRSSAGRQPSRAGQQQPGSSHRHKEWNANWNSVLSAQVSLIVMQNVVNHKAVGRRRWDWPAGRIE
jgi:hypothetical protein